MLLLDCLAIICSKPPFAINTLTLALALAHTFLYSRQLSESVIESEKRAGGAIEATASRRAELRAVREQLRKQKSGTSAGAGAGDATAVLFTSLIAERDTLRAELESLENEIDRLRDNGRPNGPAALAREKKRAAQAIADRGAPLKPSVVPQPLALPMAVGAPVRVAVGSGVIVPPDYSGSEDTFQGVIREVITVAPMKPV